MTDKKTQVRSTEEALKLALEALEDTLSGDLTPYQAAKTIAAIREALMSVPDGADSALDRMAENARELGLDYEPPCKTGSQCTSKCQQCEQPAQEPVAWRYNGNLHEFDPSDWATGPVIPLYTSPQSKPWVGLTDEDIAEAMTYWSSDEHSAYGGAEAAAGEYFDVEESWRYIEAKLKEKNT